MYNLGKKKGERPYKSENSKSLSVRYVKLGYYLG